MLEVLSCPYLMFSASHHMVYFSLFTIDGCTCDNRCLDWISLTLNYSLSIMDFQVILLHRGFESICYWTSHFTQHTNIIFKPKSSKCQINFILLYKLIQLFFISLILELHDFMRHINLEVHNIFYIIFMYLIPQIVWFTSNFHWTLII